MEYPGSHINVKIMGVNYTCVIYPDCVSSGYRVLVLQEQLYFHVCLQKHIAENGLGLDNLYCQSPI